MSTRYFSDDVLRPILDAPVDGDAAGVKITRREKMDNLLNQGQPCTTDKKDKHKILDVLKINEKPLAAIPYYSQSKTAEDSINKADLCKAIESLVRKNPSEPYFSNDSTHYDNKKLKEMCNVIASEDKGNPIITPEFCSRKGLSKTDIFNQLSSYLKSKTGSVAQPAAAAAAANPPPALVDVVEAEAEEKSNSVTSVATAATVASAIQKIKKRVSKTKKGAVPSAPVEQAVEAVSVVPVPVPVQNRDVIEILDTPPAEDEKDLPVLDFPKSAPLSVVPPPIVVDSVDKHTPKAVAAYEPTSPEFPPSPNTFLLLSPAAHVPKSPDYPPPSHVPKSPDYPPPSYLSSPADEKQEEQQPFATAAASNEKMDWAMAAATSGRPSTERVVFPQESTIDRTTLPSSLFKPNMFKPDSSSSQLKNKTKQFMSMLL